MTLRFLAAGDTALTLELGDRAELGLSMRVLALYRRIVDEALPGVVEVVPTLRSLTVHYDPCVTAAANLRAALGPLAEAAAAHLPGGSSSDVAEWPTAARRWVLPACYEPQHGPDVEAIAKSCGLTPLQVTSLHACVPYRVLMVGFLPGHPYMGDLPPPLRVPRRDTPRTAVPPGSIAIATTMTVIYPQESPGGWHIIGRTPVSLFDPRRAEPSLLAPGDEVRFRPIGGEEYAALAAKAADGTWAAEPEKGAA